MCESMVRVSQFLFQYPVLPNSSTGMCCKPNQRQHKYTYTDTCIHMYACAHTYIYVHISMRLRMRIDPHACCEASKAERYKKILSSLLKLAHTQMQIDIHQYIHTYVCMYTCTFNARLIAKSNQGLRAGNNNSNSNKQCNCSRLLLISLSPSHNCSFSIDICSLFCHFNFQEY